jgi:hypothetical protein
VDTLTLEHGNYVQRFLNARVESQTPWMLADPLRKGSEMTCQSALFPEGREFNERGNGLREGTE